MPRISIILVLFILAIALAGCGTKQDAANQAPAQTQSGSAATATAKTTAKSDKTRPVFGPLEKFKITEKTINDTKAATYYVNIMAELYLRALGEAVERTDGIKWVAAFLDTDRPVYAAEKKYIDECFAKGIKMRLINYGLFESPTKGRIIEEDTDHHLYEHLVYTEYTMEITYADGSKETKKLRRVFTMRQRQVFGRKDRGDDFLQRISVVITDIKDAGIVGVDAAPLNAADYVIRYLPTGEVIEINKSLDFKPGNTKIALEHYYPNGQDYIAGITIYGKELRDKQGGQRRRPAGKNS